MKYFVFLFLFLSLPIVVHSKIDSSPQIFLPPAQSQYFESYQQTPLTWWNFAFFDNEYTSRDEACQKLNSLGQSSLFFNPCREIPISSEWLEQWGREQTLFTPPPTHEHLALALNRTIVQLSLPVSTEKLNLLRKNPLSQYQLFTETLIPFFKQENEKGRWQTLPFLLSFPPSQPKDLLTWMNFGQTKNRAIEKIHWMGPHIGIYQNKTQIVADLTWVMLFGSLFVLGLIFFLIFSKRILFFLLLPIIGTSVAMATFAVQTYWGSIHGLTLAFGSGLVGISMDYAFHGWKSKHSRQLWRSNLISFFTTIICFLLLSLFSSPLVKQISLFSTFGLTISFLLCFLVSKLLTKNYSGPDLVIRPTNFPLKWIPWILGLLFAVGVFAVFNLKNDFSLQRMDSAHNNFSKVELSHTNLSPKNKMHFIFTPKNDFQKLKEVLKWSQSHSISAINPLSFFPENINFSKVREQWLKTSCTEGSGFYNLQKAQQNKMLFKDFFDHLNCQKLKKETRQWPELTMQLFSSKEHTLTILKITNPNEGSLIEGTFPNSFSLSVLTEDFPKQLKKESMQFLTITFLSVFLFLFIFLGLNSILTFIPAIGAFSGLSLTLYLFSQPISFISFISMIILLGLTLDYGIFSTSNLIRRENLENVFGSILLSSFTSIAGFAPLAFCKHPVLRDMGLTILSGLIGALIFTYLGYTYLNIKLEKRNV